MHLARHDLVESSPAHNDNSLDNEGHTSARTRACTTFAKPQMCRSFRKNLGRWPAFLADIYRDQAPINAKLPPVQHFIGIDASRENVSTR